MCIYDEHWADRDGQSSDPFSGGPHHPLPPEPVLFQLLLRTSASSPFQKPMSWENLKGRPIQWMHLKIQSASLPSRDRKFRNRRLFSVTCHILTYHHQRASVVHKLGLPQGKGKIGSHCVGFPQYGQLFNIKLDGTLRMLI